MRRVFLGILAAASIAVLVLAGHQSTNAADHGDSPSAVGPCDIADLYSWMTPDANRLVMAMTTNAAALSDQCQYVFHVGSASAFGEQLTSTMVLCQYQNNAITCWVGEAGETQGGAYQAKVSGATGATLEDEGIKLYAGSREDPFFFNLAGFNAAVETVRGAAGGLTPDEYGCPDVDANTAAMLVEQLSTDGAGGPAVDSFAGKNVTALVVELDKTLVNSGGPTLAIWASTRQR